MPERAYPLEQRWDALPLRRVRSVDRSSLLSPLETAPPWFYSGAIDEPFDFCAAVRRLLDEVVRRLPELAHVHVPRILFAVTQARACGVHGLQARVTPLRFHGGALVRLRRGTPYQVQRYFEGEHEFLYLMTFCLPRFLDQDFDAKLVTLLHELYHIGPAFDGDLRRHEGRYQLHTHSQRNYDCQMAALARRYLDAGPDPRLHGFLRLNFAQLVHRHGAILGVMVPRPKIIPLLGHLAPANGAAGLGGGHA